MTGFKDYIHAGFKFFKKNFVKSPVYPLLQTGRPSKDVFLPPLYDVLNITTGNELAKGRLVYKGTVYNFDVDTFYHIHDAATGVHDYIHGFEWLNILYNSNTFNSRALARHLILKWMKLFQKSYHEVAWHPESAGLRLVNLIKLYDFYAQSARDDFKEYLLKGILVQLKQTSSLLGLAETLNEKLACLAGILYAQLFFKMPPKRINNTLKQIDGLCAHLVESWAENKTSIRALLREFKLLYAIRKTFNWHQFEYDAAIIDEALTKVETMIAFFHFQGGFFFTEEPPQVSHEVESLLTNRSISSVGSRFLGYEKLQSYNTLAVINVQSEEIFEREEDLPPAPFNFEVAVNGEEGPLLVGSSVFLIPNNEAAQPQTIVQEAKSKRYGDKSHQWMEMMSKRVEYGLPYTHKRKIYVTKQNVRGEDFVNSPIKNYQYCATFEFNGDIYKVGDDCFRVTTAEGASWMFKVENTLKIVRFQGEKKLLVKGHVVNEEEDYSAPPIKWEMQKLSLK